METHLESTSICERQGELSQKAPRYVIGKRTHSGSNKDFLKLHYIRRSSLAVVNSFSLYVYNIIKLLISFKRKLVVTIFSYY